LTETVSRVNCHTFYGPPCSISVGAETHLCEITLDLLAVKLVVVQLLVGSGGRLGALKYDTCSTETFQVLKLNGCLVVTEQRLKVLLYVHHRSTVNTNNISHHLHQFASNVKKPKQQHHTLIMFLLYNLRGNGYLGFIGDKSGISNVCDYQDGAWVTQY